MCAFYSVGILQYCTGLGIRRATYLFTYLLRNAGWYEWVTSRRVSSKFTVHGAQVARHTTAGPEATIRGRCIHRRGRWVLPKGGICMTGGGRRDERAPQCAPQPFATPCKGYCGTGTVGGGDHLGHHPLGHVPQVACHLGHHLPPRVPEVDYHLPPGASPPPAVALWWRGRESCRRAVVTLGAC